MTMADRYCSLLDYLYGKTNCAYLSDLRFLNAGERQHLAREIRQISPEAAPLADWNEALRYLTGEADAADADAARKALISNLETAPTAKTGGSRW